MNDRWLRVKRVLMYALLLFWCGLFFDSISRANAHRYRAGDWSTMGEVRAVNGEWRAVLYERRDLPDALHLGLIGLRWIVGLTLEGWVIYKLLAPVLKSFREQDSRARCIAAGASLVGGLIVIVGGFVIYLATAPRLDMRDVFFIPGFESFWILIAVINPLVGPLIGLGCGILAHYPWRGLGYGLSFHVAVYLAMMLLSPGFT
ncbi:MAG: hypothetical protein JSS27_09935 [Planctomycetes bacterium]|nr:hypothetical protein [Planctomycetota bacterium]